MVCRLSSSFLSVISKFFYIKACYCLPSSLRHMLNLQVSSPTFNIFFFLISLYLFASFLVNDFFFFFYTCYEIFSLTKSSHKKLLK